MRPTFSIIFFTVASGAGYGLWMLAALVLLVGFEPSGGALDAGELADFILLALVSGFVLVSAGLLSSLGHLGQPQRAWRALSQWRSSWLSREGVASLLCFVPACALLLPRVLGGSQEFHGALHASASWLLQAAIIHALAALLLVGSAITVFCTANIYACLKPIRAWHNGFVVPGYLLLGIHAGALWAWLLASLLHATPVLNVMMAIVCVTALAAGLLKFAYWRFVDRSAGERGPDPTGLASLGTLRSVEQPHTEENYLTHEMGFRLARKHARKLRMLVLACGFGLPIILVMLALLLPDLNPLFAWLALVFGMVGVFLERWLFFAEAKHTVMLYYGARRT